jgi:hypothetical protein
MPNLRERYTKEIVPALMQEFSFRNVMEVPRVQKVVVNIGMGEALDNAKSLDAAVNDLQTITGQKVMVTKAKKDISNFKLRADLSIRRGPLRRCGPGPLLGACPTPPPLTTLRGRRKEGEGKGRVLASPAHVRASEPGGDRKGVRTPSTGWRQPVEKATLERGFSGPKAPRVQRSASSFREEVREAALPGNSRASGRQLGRSPF